MLREMMKSKIHRATVTGADIDYEGSIGIDENLMREADLLPNERVDVYNLSNGQRFSTYVITAEKNSGAIVLNGAAARCVTVKDRVIIVSYCHVDESELSSFKPNIIVLDERNRIAKGGRTKYIRQAFDT